MGTPAQADFMLLGGKRMRRLRPQSQGAGVAGLSGPGPAGRSLLGNSATAIAGRCPLPHAWVAPGAGEISPAAGSPTSIQCKLWTAGRSAAKSTRQFRESSLRNRAGKAMGYNVAVVGATGNVGREMLSILNERQFPVQELYALASRRSLGVEVSFGESTLKCKDLASFDFSGIDFCLMSAGGSVSKEWSPKIAAKGAIVIDNSSAWRYDQDVPLIVPEVNADAVAGYVKKRIIANPNCSTAQLVVALKPLHERATIKRVVVAT